MIYYGWNIEDKRMMHAVIERKTHDKTPIFVECDETGKILNSNREYEMGIDCGEQWFSARRLRNSNVYRWHSENPVESGTYLVMTNDDQFLILDWNDEDDNWYEGNYFDIDNRVRVNTGVVKCWCENNISTLF